MLNDIFKAYKFGVKCGLCLEALVIGVATSDFVCKKAKKYISKAGKDFCKKMEDKFDKMGDNNEEKIIHFNNDGTVNCESKKC